MLQLAKIGRLIALGCLGTILTSFPVLSAERITFILAPFSRTLEISSLEKELKRITASARTKRTCFDNRISNVRVLPPFRKIH